MYHYIITTSIRLKKIIKIGTYISIGIISLMLIFSALLIVFKDTIKARAIQEINTYLNKKVHIGYIDIGIWNSFPDLSLRFDDVLIHSKFNDEITVDTALYANQLLLRFSPMDFLKGNYTVHQIDVKTAVFNMEIQKDGTVNYDFITSKSDSLDTNTNFNFELEAIRIENTHFSYLNRATGQDYATRIDDMTLKGTFTASNYTLKAQTNFWVKHIKNKQIALVKNKNATCELTLAIDNENDVVAIQNAALTVNKIPFNIDGQVSNDSLNFVIEAPDIHLKEFTNNFSFEELAIVDEINGDGDVGISIHIRGELAATKSPAIDADFFIKNGSLSDAGFSITGLQAKGNYTNGVASKQEALTLTSLSFNSLGNSFNGKLTLTDFNQPRLMGNMKGGVNLRMIHRLFGPFGCKELEGTVLVNGNFDLRLNDPKYDPKNITIYDLRANASVKDVNLVFLADDQRYTLTDGDFVIRNQQAILKHIHFKTKQSDLTIDGKFNQIADYFKQDKPLIIDASIESSYLNIHELSNSNSNTHKSWLLPNDIKGKINLQLTQVDYSEHSYKNIKTRMNFDYRALHFPYISGENSGSKIKGGLSITETSPMILEVTTKLNSPAIYFDRLFAEWNDFDQTTIKAENIKGQAAINLDFKGSFNLFTEEIYKENFEATIGITIQDGALINVETFKEITSSLKSSGTRLLLSKERINSFEKELLNLNFETFKNELRIEKGVITIPKMEIKSNALDLKLSGTHSFDNQIDYSFDFRFRELKGKQRNSEFGEIIDDGTGFRIFLRMQGDLDDPTFSWDKAAQKEQRTAQREQAKDDLKSVLKTGLGINKKDSTIQNYSKPTKPQEKMIVTFENDSISDSFEPEEKKKRKGKLLKKFEEWSKENEAEEEQFELGD